MLSFLSKILESSRHDGDNFEQLLTGWMRGCVPHSESSLSPYLPADSVRPMIEELNIMRESNMSES